MRVLAAVCVLLVVVGFVFSWGSDGHQIVGQVGQAFLTPTTLGAVNKMLPNGETLATIASWPDNYDHTSEGSWSEHLHYVNVPDDARNFQYVDCTPPEADPAGCVVTAITNTTDRLLNNLQQNYWETCTQSSDSTPPCDLSYLVHWLGDVHQPLHVAYSSDEGGNLYDVDFYGTCTNLHSVWDYGLIEQYESNNDYVWQDVAQDIISWLHENPNVFDHVVSFQFPGEWGNETFTLARNIPYNFSPGSVPANSDWVLDLNFTTTVLPYRNPAPKEVRSSCSSSPVIGDNYYYRTIEVVLSQLAKGGARLANRLNMMYDPSYNGTYPFYF